MECMAVPPKYREMGDFHEYYNGTRKAPFLTIYIGGNHEASNHHLELFYGGWVAPNIYYLGAAGVVRCGSLRIAGLSGIWKGYDYRKPRYEQLPFTADDVKTVYHIREYDVERLRHVRTQIDIGISHDWPQGVEWEGDSHALFKMKPLFEADARNKHLGSPVTKDLLDHLRPSYWFSAHLHCKYVAVIDHDKPEITQLKEPSQTISIPISLDEGAKDRPKEVSLNVVSKNSEEIELTEDETDAATVPKGDSFTTEAPMSDKDQDIRQQLPASFTKPVPHVTRPIPTSISNKSTRFLALDKCLPGRQFLQLLQIEPIQASALEVAEHSNTLTYDKEWLALNRVFSNHLGLGPTRAVDRNNLDTAYLSLINEAEAWIEENLVKPGKMRIPQNFEQLLAQQSLDQTIQDAIQTTTFPNPQTVAFCEMIDIPLPFPPGSLGQGNTGKVPMGNGIHRGSRGHRGRMRGQPGAWRGNKGRRG